MNTRCIFCLLDRSKEIIKIIAKNNIQIQKQISDHDDIIENLTRQLHVNIQNERILKFDTRCTKDNYYDHVKNTIIEMDEKYMKN